jgi:hypothetical protein
MHTLDRAILEHCYESFRPLSELRKQVPHGSLYRHVNLLCKLGFLEKQSSFYRTTEGGRRALVTASTKRTFNGFVDMYAPLAEVPTPTHRAMCELIFAAAVARHHKIRPDRHPFFGAVGQTLRWKTSLGQFCCYALGLDPAQHLVECGSESGKSLSIRRDHGGTVIFKRELLDAPFVVLDEFLCAEPSVRPSLQLFLTGRLEVPFENARLTIQPVPLLTLNVRDRPTLEERLGLSAPQIRRGLIANFDAVSMPDLALIGDRAVLAAKQSSPLRLDPPTVDCAPHQRVIVQTLRQILAPAAESRVDVQIVTTLCTGMSAFIRDAEAAIVQVLYDVGLMAESMEWTNPGWIEAVLHCSLSEGRSAARHTDTSASTSPVPGKPGAHPVPAPALPAAIPLHGPQLRRETTPSLGVSDALKNLLIWAAVDTGQSLEELLSALVNLYRIHRKDPNTITMLTRALRIADHLKLAEVEIATLEQYVATEAILKRAGLGMNDVPEALRLIPLIEGLPQSWTWKQARDAMRAVAYVLRHGIDPNHVGEFMAFHRALEQCGINEQYLAELVTALEKAGAHGLRKRKTLDRLIVRAARQVDVEDLTQQTQELAAVIERLKARREGLGKSIEEEESRIEALREQEEALRDRLDALAGEVAGYEQERTMLHAARLLLEKRAAAAPASAAEAQQSQRQEPNPQSGHAQSGAPQNGQWWDQVLRVLQQGGGQPNAGSEKSKT